MGETTTILAQSVIDEYRNALADAMGELMLARAHIKALQARLAEMENAAAEGGGQ